MAFSGTLARYAVIDSKLKLLSRDVLVFGVGLAIAALLAILISNKPKDPVYRELFQHEFELWRQGSILQRVTIDINGTPVRVDVVSQEREVAIGFTRDPIPSLTANGTLESLHQWSCYQIENGVVAVGIQKPYFHSLYQPQ